MTVQQLIDQLKNIDPTLPVVIYNPERDYNADLYSVKQEFDEDSQEEVLQLWDGN